MAEYTIELNRLLASGFPLKLDSYPVPNFLRTEVEKTTWRNALNSKIISHYYFNEICCLPPDRFRHFLVTRMMEIMPIKCKLYEALNEDWKFHTGSTITTINDSENTNRGTNTHSGDDTTKSNNTTTNDLKNYSLGVTSDTPGAMLNITSDIGLNTYASRAVKTDSKNTGTVTDASSDTISYNSQTGYDGTNTTHSEHKITGVHGKSYAELFKEYSKALRNIDLEVINELSDCFMHIY